MTVLEQVQRARHPREAIEILAKAIDGLKSQSSQATEQLAWETWGDGGDKLPVAAISDEERKRVEAEIKLLQDQIAAATGEDQQALEAKLRLKRDEMIPPPNFGQIEGGSQASAMTDEGSAVQVDLPIATPIMMQERAEVAREIGLADEFSMDVAESFIKGGPLLLYYSNRDYVMGLPPSLKFKFVQDVAQFSAQEAHEMARDILKDEEAGDVDSVIGRIYGL